MFSYEAVDWNIKIASFYRPGTYSNSVSENEILPLSQASQWLEVVFLLIPEWIYTFLEDILRKTD